MERFKFPPKVRAAIYGANVLGTPVVTYLLARNIIGVKEVALWSAEMVAVFTMAGLNVSSSK